MNVKSIPEATPPKPHTPNIRPIFNHETHKKRGVAREISPSYGANVDLEDLKDVLETIIRDEETRRELLSKMKKSLSEKKNKKKIEHRNSSIRIQMNGQE